ncbi:heme-binding protein soul2 [Anguilla anguilla]|uniref:Heme-binding protein 2-like n=1 Tax=Anguilla anguilla TaxID=7936 RepID=A0A9D3LMK6_ANGAN|nr:heme-binding protein soul2 [Anguilla anguilla]KAG5831078.1 hypothetical protein ANANG_G00300050 [Anguilla anguilla]
MRTFFTEGTVFVCSILVCLQTVNGWTPPSFCRGYVCPEYRLVHAYENFEERFYNTSHWAITEIEDTDTGTLIAAYNKLDAYINGANELSQKIPPANPVAVTILKSDSGEEDRYFVSLYVPPDTSFPKPTDSTIEEFTIPAGTIFVRVFGGRPSVSNWLDNLEKLEEDLQSAEKQYNPLRQMALDYDSPLKLFYRHDEVWISEA